MQTLSNQGMLRPIQPFFQVIRGEKSASPIGVSKGGSVLVLVLKIYLPLFCLQHKERQSCILLPAKER